MPPALRSSSDKMSRLRSTPLLLLVLAALCLESALAARPEPEQQQVLDLGKRKPPKVINFRSPKGLFIQERASKELPGPGQHFAFGALKPWGEIHDLLDRRPEAKLMLLVRHGQSVSNYLGDTLGPDEWYNVQQTCSYTPEDGSATFKVFDAELTDLGRSEAKALNGMLDSSNWFSKLTGGRRAVAVLSPLSRCLQTAGLVLDNLPIDRVHVEENIRETLGEDTCDARRSVSDPDPDDPSRLEGPCSFRDGLRSLFPRYEFPVVDENARELRRASNESAVERRKHKGRDKRPGLGFGLLTDWDAMWTRDREGQKHQVKRAVNFLFDVFDLLEEQVVVVVTHSGTVRSILLAAGREPYRPQNTELVPLVVEERGGRRQSGDDGLEWVWGVEGGETGAAM